MGVEMKSVYLIAELNKDSRTGWDLAGERILYSDRTAAQAFADRWNDRFGGGHIVIEFTVSYSKGIDVLATLSRSEEAAEPEPNQPKSPAATGGTERDGAKR